MFPPRIHLHGQWSRHVSAALRCHVTDVFAYCGPGGYRYGGGYIQPGTATQNGMVLMNGFDTSANRCFVRAKNDASPPQINAQVACLAFIHD